MSPTVGADVSEDLRERIDEYREDNESRSAAVRRLLRAGLDAEEADQLHPASLALVLLATLIFGASPQVTISFNVAGVPMYAVALLLFTVAALLNRESVRERLRGLYTRIR
jgi:hypothetical protein